MSARLCKLKMDGDLSRVWKMPSQSGREDPQGTAAHTVPMPPKPSVLLSAGLLAGVAHW